MMKHFLLLLFVLILASCEKEDPAYPCEVEKFGTLTVENFTCCTLKVYVNGELKILLAARQKEHLPRIPIGNARVQAEQSNSSKKWDVNRQMVACEFTKVIFSD